MSRSRKGSKGPGHEYWGRRPGNKSGAVPGKLTKKQTRRAERRLAKPTTTGHLVRRFGRADHEDTP